jgi:hypothetical protein
MQEKTVQELGDTTSPAVIDGRGLSSFLQRTRPPHLSPVRSSEISDQMAIRTRTISKHFLDAFLSTNMFPLHPLKYAVDAFIFNFDASVTFMCDSRNQRLTILRFAANQDP